LLSHVSSFFPPSLFLTSSPSLQFWKGALHNGIISSREDENKGNDGRECGNLQVTIPCKKKCFRLYGREGVPLVDLMIGENEVQPQVILVNLHVSFK